MNRFLGILLIYARRPMCWLLIIILFGIGAFIWQLSSVKIEVDGRGVLRRVANMVLGNQTHVHSLESLTAAVESPDGRPVVIDYGRLASDIRNGNRKTNDAGVDYWEPITEDVATLRLEQLSMPPLTQSLTTGSCQVQQSTIKQMGTLSSLEHLELGFPASNLVAADLSPLTGLVNLTSLDLGSFTKIDSLAPLQKLPKLETLTIGNHQLVTAQAMREVAAIDSLRQLFLPDLHRNPIALSALKELDQSLLERVFIAVPVADAVTLQAIGKFIPNVPIGGSKYSPVRAFVCLGVLWTAIMFNFLGVHFSALVTLPAAELTPGYRAAQQRVAWAVMLGLIGLGAGSMWSYQVSPLLAIPLAASALLGSVCTTIPVQTRTKPTSKPEFLQGIAIVVMIFGVLAWAVQRPLENEHFLVYPPWWPVLLLSLTTVYFAVKFNRLMGSTCRQRIAAGNAPILSFFDLQQAKAKLNAQRSGEAAEPYERAMNGGVAIGWLLLVVLLVHLYLPSSWFTPMLDRAFKAYLPLIALTGLMLVVFKWWSRVPLLAMMMTRPPNRRSQIRQIFVGVAKDFARTGPFLVAAVLLIGSSIAGEFSGRLESTLLTVLMAIGVLAVFYPVTLWMLTLRSVFWSGVTGVIALSVSGFFMIVVIAIDDGKILSVFRDNPSLGLVSFSALLMAIGVAAAAFMWRFYLRLEWGRYLNR